MYTKKKHSRLKVAFYDSHLIEKSNSQAYQELFVLSILNGKKNGFFLEVGAYHSSKISNTWNLEKVFGWRGLSLDKCKGCVEDFRENRSCNFLLCDATTLDYKKALSDVNAPSQIDYLQLDIDPSIITYQALLRIPFDEYTFSVITFEHDYFRSRDTNSSEVRNKSREYLQSKGYVLVAGDICTKKEQAFEDWYVSSEIASSQYFRENFSLQPEFNRKGEEWILQNQSKLF